MPSFLRTPKEDGEIYTDATRDEIVVQIALHVGEGNEFDCLEVRKSLVGSKGEQLEKSAVIEKAKAEAVALHAKKKEELKNKK